MHKTRISFFTLILLLCLIPGSSFADSKWSIKLQGGWAYISGGDVNPGTQGFFDWGKTTYPPPEGGAIEGDFSPMHRGYEIGGDIIFQLTPSIGVGIGVGYLALSTDFNDQDMWIDWTVGGEAWHVFYFREGTELEALPIRLSLFLTLPIGRKVDVTADAGLSYYARARYYAEWIAIESVVTTMNPWQTFTTTADKKGVPLGLQGGLGIEYRILRNLGFFMEARGRCARFRGLEGTTTSVAGELSGGLVPEFTENGALFYDETPNLPGAPRLIMVQSAPDGELHRAVVDFSGVSLGVGFRIRL